MSKETLSTSAIAKEVPKIKLGLQEKYEEEKKTLPPETEPLSPENIGVDTVDELPNPSGYRILVLPFTPKTKTKGGILFSQETLDKALELAMEAAEVYRSTTKKRYSKLFLDLNSNFKLYTKGKSEEAILKALTKCRDRKLFEEREINMLGYKYLLEHKKPKIEGTKQTFWVSDMEPRIVECEEVSNFRTLSEVWNLIF